MYKLDYNEEKKTNKKKNISYLKIKFYYFESTYIKHIFKKYIKSATSTILYFGICSFNNKLCKAFIIFNKLRN